MSAEFPTNLPTFTDPALTENLGDMCGGLGHVNEIKKLHAEIAAGLVKVGKDSSAVTTSHDYKLSGVTGTDKAVSKTGTEVLTNKQLTTPIIPSMYQDDGKTKLMTLPNTASDTLVTIAATQTLTNKTLTSPKINENVALTTTATELNLFHSNLVSPTTWTPTIGAVGGTAPTYTDVFTSTYSQIGKMIFCTFVWTNSSGGTAGAGDVLLTGSLPVTAASVAGTRIGTVLSYNGTTYMDCPIRIASSTTFLFQKIDTLSSYLASYQNNVTRGLMGSFFYFAA
jgi:hypothetical protein